MHNTDKCNYFDPTTKSEVEVPTMQNAFGVVSHAGEVVTPTTPRSTRVSLSLSYRS